MDPQGEMLLKRAALLRRAGRVDEAIAAYQQLLAREPDLPDSWYNLAWLQRQARQFEEALVSYGEALRRAVRGAEEVHLNRAVILSDHLARPAEAEAELQKALALNPDYVPALLNLGNLNEDLGNGAAAEAAYKRALEVAPHDAMALSRLASLSQAPELESALRSGLARPGVSSADQAHIGFALAGLLDGQGRYDEAFEAARRANAASRAATGARYDRAAVEAAVAALIDSFDAAAAAESPATVAPVFILGMFRSGSTLIEQILSGHRRVVAAGELDLIPELVKTIPGYPRSAASAGEAALRSWRDFYSKGVQRLAGGDALVTDKRPDNFLHIGLIKRLFPGAKIVHTRRDRLDNLVSLYFLHLDADMAYALDLADAADWHGQYERLMAHWKSLYPDDIFDLGYEELVTSPEPLLRRLLGFLGLDWEEGLLDFSRSARPVKTASVWQVRKPLHRASIGRARNYAAQLRTALGDEFY
ncbi:MAG: sulfotransferase [Bacillota bacterium]